MNRLCEENNAEILEKSQVESSYLVSFNALFNQNKSCT